MLWLFLNNTVVKEKSLSQVECHTYNQNTQAKLYMVYDTFMQYLPKQHGYEENPKVMILKVPQTSPQFPLNIQVFFTGNSSTMWSNKWKYCPIKIQQLTMIWLAKQEVTHSLSNALGTQAMNEALRVGTPEVGWAYFASKPGSRHRLLRRRSPTIVAGRCGQPPLFPYRSIHPLRIHSGFLDMKLG